MKLNFIKSILMKKVFLSLFCILFFSSFANGREKDNIVNMPNGRIAFSSDGNLHDTDDWGATAMSLAIIYYSGLEERFVHYDYNNHIGPNSNKEWEKKMHEAAKGGAKRFKLDVSRVFDDQADIDLAIENFRKEANISTSDNPLWFICAGPMHVPYLLLSSVDKDCLSYIHIITHGRWNNEHSKKNCPKSECLYTLENIKRDFPDVNIHYLCDQNKSNGENDFQSHISNWSWLKESGNKDLIWLYNMDDTCFLKNPKMPDTRELFDVSDAGMTFWLISGGPNGGNDKAGSKEIKRLFSNKLK